MDSRYPSHYFGSQRGISERIQNLRAFYGGSDNTTPFFDRPQYVKHNSIGKARDLGALPFGSYDIQGLINTKAGSNTIFIAFTLPLASRLLIQVPDSGGFTIKEGLSLSLTRLPRTLLPLVEERRVLTLDGMPADSLNSTVSTIEFTATRQGGQADPYVDFDYWVQGYTDGDSQPIFEQSTVFTPSAQAFLDEFSVFSIPHLAAGDYRLALSSLTWRELPYRVLLRWYPWVPLSGEADSSADVSATMTIA